MKTTVPSEHDEQATVCQWLDLMGVEYYAVPNGMFTKLKGAAAGKHMNKLKREGFKVGVPDLVVLLNGGRSVYIEMKRQKGSKISWDQERIGDIKRIEFKEKPLQIEDKTESNGPINNQLISAIAKQKRV